MRGCPKLYGFRPCVGSCRATLHAHEQERSAIRFHLLGTLWCIGCWDTHALRDASRFCAQEGLSKRWASPCPTRHPLKHDLNVKMLHAPPLPPAPTKCNCHKVFRAGQGWERRRSSFSLSQNGKSMKRGECPTTCEMISLRVLILG